MVQVFRLKGTANTWQTETCLTKAKIMSSHQGLVDHDDPDRSHNVEHPCRNRNIHRNLFSALPPCTIPILLLLRRAGPRHTATATDFRTPKAQQWDNREIIAVLRNDPAKQSLLME
jgi:hypothetical protein